MGATLAMVTAMLPITTPPTTMALMATADSTGPTLMATASPPLTTTARGLLRLSPSTSTAVSTPPTSTALATPTATPTLPPTTTARGRLRPSPTTMVATMVATGPTGPTATAMAALDTTVEKVTTRTTAFHSYMPRPKTITPRNLFQDLQHKTGRYCQRKTKKHVKVQTAMLIVSPTSIKCNNILVAEINNRALCLP